MKFKNFTRIATSLICLMCSYYFCAAQAGCDYEVKLDNVTLQPTPYVSLGMVTLQFEICNESDSDLPVQPQSGFDAEFEVTIDATSGNMAEITTINNIGGTAAAWFDWTTGFADPTIFVGNQNQSIAAGACGTIIVEYQITQNTFDGTGPGGNGQNCVNINLQPSTLISGTACHDESDDAVQICTHVNDGTIVPVQLQSFDAELIENHSLVTWVSASEDNVSHYDVEKSSDGVLFTKIGDEEAIGTTLNGASYDFVDRKPFAGSTYYRLKMVDLDGSFEYSPIREVRRNGVVQALAAYPNPAFNYLKVETTLPFTGTLEVFDAMGRLISSKKVDQVLQNSINVIDLPNGLYFVKAQNDNYLESIPFEVRN